MQREDEHVEAPREEAEQLPDRDAPAVVQGRPRRRARAGRRTPMRATSGTQPAMRTSEIIDAAIRPPATPQPSPVTSASVATSVPTRPRMLSRFCMPYARARVEQARDEVLVVHERDERRARATTGARRSRCPGARRASRRRPARRAPRARRARPRRSARTRSARAGSARRRLAKNVIAVGVPSPARRDHEDDVGLDDRDQAAARRAERAREHDRRDVPDRERDDRRADDADGAAGDRRPRAAEMVGALTPLTVVSARPPDAPDADQHATTANAPGLDHSEAACAFFSSPRDSVSAAVSG